MGRAKTTAWMLTASMIAGGCAGEVVGSPGEGLTISHDEGDTLAGALVTDTATLEFVATLEAPGVTAARIDVDGHPFEVRVDRNAGAAQADGHGHTLTEAQRTALGQLVEGMEERMGESLADQPHVATMLRMAEYWSIAPDGHAHAGRTLVLPGTSLEATHDDENVAGRVEASVGNDGIACLTVGYWYRAYYDLGDNGTRYSEVVQAGACWGNNAIGGQYDCMGRCGADCGNWWWASGYSLDCLDHDVCSYRRLASGGSSDDDCGDEYDHAADEWMWSTWVGCTGPGNGMGC